MQRLKRRKFRLKRRAKRLRTSEAYDEALLDRIRARNGRPDSPLMSTTPPDAAAMKSMRRSRPSPIVVAATSEPIAAQESPPVQASLHPALEPAVEPSLKPSLGSSLIARGILRKQASSASDPLAPIRRMSQAEKIAFFS